MDVDVTSFTVLQYLLLQLLLHITNFSLTIYSNLFLWTENGHLCVLSYHLQNFSKEVAGWKNGSLSCLDEINVWLGLQEKCQRLACWAWGMSKGRPETRMWRGLQTTAGPRSAVSPPREINYPVVRGNSGTHLPTAKVGTSQSLQG